MAFLHNNITIKRKFPREIRGIESIQIPLSDGTELAARIWLPVDAETDPVPALLEYLPYRKNDMTAWRDSIRHPYLAGHGYAAVRVDIRGNGDSDGLMLDEYTAQELSDCLEILNWLEAQPWCTGKVGMFGKSWGGFNALQVAALQPPQLKAIITIASTDDRYADDVHYMGGCILGSEMLSWASTMLCYNASPPDPRFVGDKWRELWLNRLEETPPFVEAWLSHQRRDAFWKHGSVCENYANIQCAVYAVGSWADGYTNAVPRLLEGLSAPRKGLLGPWAHNFPENSAPGPAIGFLQESLRWWDYWLKEIDTGIMDEPMLRTWIEGSYTPSPTRLMSDGYWVSDPSWPSPNISLTDIPLLGNNMPQKLKSPQITGIDSGRWLSFGRPYHHAMDQRAEDGRSICYTSDVQPEHTILGVPTVHLLLSVDQPQASVAVRLCDVAPDGTSTLVSWGLCNLTHRDGHENPLLMPVDTPVDVTVKLNVCGHRQKDGHRWRVAISPTYWPHLWPSPQEVTLTLESCLLSLPLRAGTPADESVVPFASPECAPPLEIEQLKDGYSTAEVTLERQRNATILRYEEDDGTVRYPDGLIFSTRSADIFEIVEGDPLSAVATSRRSRCFGRGEWKVEIKTDSVMHCDEENFYVENQLTAHEGDSIAFQRSWEKKIPRDFQ